MDPSYPETPSGRYYLGFALAQRVAHPPRGVPAASGSTLLVRRQILETIGGFDPELSCNEDSELPGASNAPVTGSISIPNSGSATDHRRLHRGVWRKTMHSLLRCLLLYLNLMPSRWRGHDWGYWSTAPSRNSAARRSR